MDKSAALILTIIFGMSFFALAENSPEALAEKVKSEIGGHYYGSFEVTADQNGNIDIEGEVETLYDKYRIFEIAARVKGIKSITNNLVVNTPTLPDSMIKANVLHELELVSAIMEPERIKVSVDNGVVFLSGKISFYREKKMAQTVASWQEGVKGVVNDLELLPPQVAKSDENLKRVLQGILDDRFPLEKNVNLTVEDGVVTLTGTVNDLWSKEEIEKQFSNILGIKLVKNKLVTASEAAF